MILSAYITPHPPLIIPTVGRGSEEGIRDTISAFDRIGKEIAEQKPDTIIFITPHSIMYSDYIHISPGKKATGDMQNFGDFKTRFDLTYDTELAAEAEFYALQSGIEAGGLGEQSAKLDHGTTVPLYFIDKYYKDYKALRVSISGLSFIDHYGFGKCLTRASESLGRKTIILASGDLSHRLTHDGPYGYKEQGPEFDRRVTDIMATGDFYRFFDFTEDFCDKAGECGLRSFIMMAGALDGYSVESELLSYEGPFGVGYAVASFHPGRVDESRRFDKIYLQSKEQEVTKTRQNESPHVALARRSLESYILNKEQISIPADTPRELTDNKAGVFVTLYKDDRLRGCIGTIAPTTASIAAEIITNAISAGTGDPRFETVRPEELSSLVYSVDVLSAPEDIDSLDELDVERYGVIVTRGERRGLLLPALDGVDTPAKQVEIALSKAGISPGEKYSLQRFEVIRHT